MKAVLIPVAYEATTSYLKGCARGPAAVLRALETLREEGDLEEARVAGNMAVAFDMSLGEPGQTFQRIEESLLSLIPRYIDEGCFPFILGGEHAVTLAAFKAVRKRHRDLDIVQCDAHSDERDAFEGTGLSHACVMRRIASLEAGSVVAAGVRSQCMEEADFMRERSIPVIPPGDINGGREAWREQVKGPSGPVYLTIDMDFFDPSVAPGVGTPEPGGVLYRPALRFLETITRSRRVVAIDIVELMPVAGQSRTERLAARLLLKLLSWAGSS